MRLHVGIAALLAIIGSLRAAEQPTQPKPAYPVWDGKETIEEYAKRLNVPATRSLELGNNLKMELVLIPAGEFMMGSRPVTIPAPFYMGKYPVTQEQWQQVMNWNESYFTGKNNPVDSVSWGETQVFCDKVTERTKQIVRLPTEAEWEYACRAGTSTIYYSGDTEDDLRRVAWYDANSSHSTHPVGQKEPNRFALFDMVGNVWQWCQDLYEYSSAQEKADDRFSLGTHRAVRGGSWDGYAETCRSDYRMWRNPAEPDSRVGLRIIAPVLSSR
jgi:formylglycine-generating enzyme required for sulfatase activity